MARENGTVFNNSTKQIDRNLDASGNPVTSRGLITYDTATAFNNGDKVSFDVIDDGFGNLTATDVRLLAVSDPDFPADEGTLYVPVTGDLNVNGITVTVKGVTVNGNVNITNGGKLILKSTSEEGAQRARVTGYIDGKQNSTLIIYKSDVNGNVFFHNNVEFKMKGGSVGGDVNIHSSQNVKKGGTVGGDVDIKSNSVSLEIDGLTLTGTGKSLTVKNNKTSTVVKNVTVNNGDVEIKNNQGCSYSNISTPNGSQDISGCNVIN